MRKAIRCRQTCNVQTCECKFYSLAYLKGAGIGISLFIRSAFYFRYKQELLLLFNCKSSNCLHSCSVYFPSSRINKGFSARINIAWRLTYHIFSQNDFLKCNRLSTRQKFQFYPWFSEQNVCARVVGVGADGRSPYFSRCFYIKMNELIRLWHSRLGLTFKLGWSTFCSVS